MKKILLYVLFTLIIVPYAFAGNVTGNIDVGLTLTHSSTAALSTATEHFPYSIIDQAITTGTSTNQMTQIWYSQRTIVSNGVDNLDFGGGLNDSFGSPLVLSRLRLLMIVAASTNIGSIGIGGPVSNGMSSLFKSTNDVMLIPPGGAALFLCPSAIAYSNEVNVSDILQLTNNSASAAMYSIYVGGSN